MKILVALLAASLPGCVLQDAIREAQCASEECQLRQFRRIEAWDQCMVRSLMETNEDCGPSPEEARPWMDWT